jgi:hypothetical protein
MSKKRLKEYSINAPKDNLEYEHTLKNIRINKSEVSCYSLDLWPECEVLEHRVIVMQSYVLGEGSEKTLVDYWTSTRQTLTMPNLVHRHRLVYKQIALSIECLLFEKVSYPIPTV